MATGRRAGTSTAKADILEAARALFAEVGYDRATIRAIARRAGVDVALVSYYYGNKKGLFREVMHLPIDPEETFGNALEGPRGGVGERLVTTALTVWEAQDTAPVVQAMLRGAVNSDVRESSVFGEFVAREMLPTLARRAGVSIETGRIVASTMFGLAFMRYLVRSPIFTAPSREELIATYGAAIQRMVDADGTAAHGTGPDAGGSGGTVA
ncbi:TetR family transcriptional regulator [Tsukamurella serpentis]